MVVLASTGRHDLWRSAHVRRSFAVIFEDADLEVLRVLLIADAVFAVDACDWAERFGQPHESLLLWNHRNFLAKKNLPAENGQMQIKTLQIIVHGLGFHHFG